MNRELKNALEGEDDLGVVIRSHIIIENYLNQLIESCMENPEAIRDLNVDFHQKVKLSIGLGLNPRFERFLNSLGTLRNDFAHNLRSSISKQDANNLYKCLDPEDKKTLQGVLKEDKKKRKDDVPSFRELEPKDKYVMTTIWSDSHPF